MPGGSAEPLLKESLALLARVSQHAEEITGMASLPMQFANEVLELAEFLIIRGEAHLEHYYAEALALACVRPAGSDIRGYKLLLLAFIRFDRRQRLLPAAEHLLPLRLTESHCAQFVQFLRSQSAIQSIYKAAAQIESYGAMGRPQKKSERIILLSRELSGQPLLAAPSPQEQLYLQLATGAA